MRRSGTGRGADNSGHPIVCDDIFEDVRVPDPNSIDHITVIGEGEYNDFKMCLQQALECLRLGEHDAGWVIYKTIDLRLLLELAEAVVDGCGNHFKEKEP